MVVPCIPVQSQFASLEAEVEQTDSPFGSSVKQTEPTCSAVIRAAVTKVSPTRHVTDRVTHTVDVISINFLAIANLQSALP